MFLSVVYKFYIVHVLLCGSHCIVPWPLKTGLHNYIYTHVCIYFHVVHDIAYSRERGCLPRSLSIFLSLWYTQFWPFLTSMTFFSLLLLNREQWWRHSTDDSWGEEFWWLYWTGEFPCSCIVLTAVHVRLKVQLCKYCNPRVHEEGGLSLAK